MGICHSFTPDGRCVSLLKILLINHCIFDLNLIERSLRRSAQRERGEPRRGTPFADS
jgi:predicted DNA-binding helix-hairpin-helix protein